MQQDNTIENKLQELENLRLPDLSQMDAHWQQMQPMLQPAVTMRPIRRWRWLWAVVAACIMGIVLVVLMNKGGVEKINIVTNPLPLTTLAAKAPPVKDTLTVSPVLPSAVISIRQLVPPSGYDTQLPDDLYTSPQPRIDTVQFNLRYLDCKDSGQSNTPLVISSTQRQEMLANLFSQLEKPVSQYAINNSKDTLLHCTEGSSLHIPANSLGGSRELVLHIREFYTKADMVLHQLTTVSNKDQLVTGGMLHISATVNDQPVNILPNQSIRLYMANTGQDMTNMQLFMGEKTTDRLPTAVARYDEQMLDVNNGAASTYLNWTAQSRYFSNINVVARQEVRVLDLDDSQADITETRRGVKAVFYRDHSSVYSKQALKRMLQKKYGDSYRKIKVRQPWRRNLLGKPRWMPVIQIGDSVWISKEQADRQKLAYAATRTFIASIPGRTDVVVDSIANEKMNRAAQQLGTKYGVDINRLGWINCDRFYKTNPTTDFIVSLGDSAANYCTMLLFDRIQSLMNGYAAGKKVVFPQVPPGEKVSIISIGINRQGQPVYCIQPAVVTKEGFSGLRFETADAATIKSTLSKN